MSILDRFEATGYQLDTTTVVVASAVGTANTLTEAATKSHDGDPEGVSFPFAIQSVDPVGDPRWILASGDYTDDAGTIKLENCRAIDSSSGVNAELPFSFGGASDNHTIRIYGTFTHEQFPKVRTGISVRLASSQSILADTLTKLAFSTEDWDIGGEHATGTYTSDFAGYRICTGQVNFEVAAAGDSLSVHIRVNGVNESVNYQESVDGSPVTVRFHKLLLLDVDDEVEIHVKNADSADAINAGAASTYWQMIETDGRDSSGGGGGGGDANPATATTAEMEAGTETALRSVSPALVKAAIDELGGGGGSVDLDVAREYTKTQNFNATVLTDAANIAWDLESNQVSSVTLAGNRTLDNPTNMVDGATYILKVVQDATGTRTLAYGAAFKWQGGTAPTLTATANAVDILTFICDGSSMFGVASQDFS